MFRAMMFWMLCFTACSGQTNTRPRSVAAKAEGTVKAPASLSGYHAAVPAATRRRELAEDNITASGYVLDAWSGSRHPIGIVIRGQTSISQQDWVELLQKGRQSERDRALYAVNLAVWARTNSVARSNALAKATVTETKVTEFLRSQADEGSARAKFEYGERLLAGRGTETNTILGWTYIQAAADLGHEPATARMKQRPERDENLESRKAGN